jgi:hypothetical protein
VRLGAGFLYHAFYEFIDFFATVACFAACTVAFLGFSLEAFFRWAQSENVLHTLKFPVFNFAVCDGFCEVVK